MRITGDYHTHSQYSHGQGDLESNIRIALKKGLKEIAITDHGPRSFNFIRLGVKNAGELLKIKEQLEELQISYPDLKLMAGVEANIINTTGELDVPDKILSKLDLVAAGLHLLIIPPDWKATKEIIIDNRLNYKLFPFSRERIRRQNTEAIINAVQKHRIDFITHPGYQLDIDTYELARTCEKEGTFLEINTRHARMIEDFIRAASKTDVNFIINSDAHNPDEVGELSAGVKMVERLKIDSSRIINYRGLKFRT